MAKGSKAAKASESEREGNRYTRAARVLAKDNSIGKSSIKIYEKFGLVLRLETTTNDVSAFKHYRKRCYGASGEGQGIIVAGNNRRGAPWSSRMT